MAGKRDAAPRTDTHPTLIRADEKSYPMPSRVTAGLFSGPAGRRHAIVMFAAALAFAVIYVYAVRAAGSARAEWLLIMIAGTALSGVAESLPEDRRFVAGVLRIVAIVALASLIVTLVVAPELVSLQ
jgi:hypothetical protein